MMPVGQNLGPLNATEGRGTGAKEGLQGWSSEPSHWGAGSSTNKHLFQWEPSHKKHRLFPQTIHHVRVVEQEELEGEEDCYMGVAALFGGLVYSKLSEFQRRVCRVLKGGRINNVNREPIMKGKALGCSTNNFVVDTGSPVVIMPLSVAERNRLEVIPADKDEPSYESHWPS